MKENQIQETTVQKYEIYGQSFDTKIDAENFKKAYESKYPTLDGICKTCADRYKCPFPDVFLDNPDNPDDAMIDIPERDKDGNIEWCPLHWENPDDNENQD